MAEVPGSVASLGHFGLAVEHYSHSTAPNRRYPDVITQRLLKAALAGRPAPYGNDDLAALAKHCTDQEDAAKKVERQVAKSAAALLLQSRIGQRFDAIVTGAADKGTWVRVFNPPVEGKLVQGTKGSMSAKSSRWSCSTPTSNGDSLISSEWDSRLRTWLSSPSWQAG